MVRSKPTKKSKSAASRIKAAGIAQSQSKAAKTNQGRAKTVSGTEEEVNDEFNDEDGGINDEISNEDDEIDFLGDLSKDQQNPHHGRQEQEVRERQNPHRDRQEQERERQNSHRDRQEQERERQNPHRGRQEQERERQNPHRGRQEQERERQNPLRRRQEQEGREMENRERIKRRRNEREDDQDYREKEDDNYSVDHLDILQLATQMLNMKDSTSQLALAVQQPAHAPSTASNEKYRLIDEEIKCLFLRSRFPPGLVFEKLVRKIFPEFETYSSTAKSIIDRCRKSFSDYRYQLRVLIEELVREFQKKLERGGTTTETQVEITNFISCEVAIKRILNRYFSAVDISEISEISMDKLIEFLRECFSIAWEERNETNTKAFYNQIKRLDKNTENLEILSRSGKNFASSLKF
ncbi:unnamed protein product [Rhizophagus irregularis]|nr:unnamed protein product [Rhizophagus irregularis]